MYFYSHNQVSTLQATDAKENAMEIRILVGAVNPSKLWDLRCDIREKLLSYLREQYPQALSQTRITLPPTLVFEN